MTYKINILTIVIDLSFISSTDIDTLWYGDAHIFSIHHHIDDLYSVPQGRWVLFMGVIIAPNLLSSNHLFVSTWSFYTCAFLIHWNVNILFGCWLKIFRFLRFLWGLTWKVIEWEIFRPQMNFDDSSFQHSLSLSIYMHDYEVICPAHFGLKKLNHPNMLNNMLSNMLNNIFLQILVSSIRG